MNIEQHASDNVNKILIGNKADMDESKRVLLIGTCFRFLAIVITKITNDYTVFVLKVIPTSRGKALADEYGIRFFETVSRMVFKFQLGI